MSTSELRGDSVRPLRPATSWPATARDYAKMAAYYRQQASRLAADEDARLDEGYRTGGPGGALPGPTQADQHRNAPQSHRQQAVERANRLASVCEDLASATEHGQNLPEVGLEDREQPVLTSIATQGTTRITQGGWRLGWWPAWAATALALSLAILFALRVNRSVATVQTVSGVVTDTLCANHHSITGTTSTGECVRTCVRLGRGRYALDDGTNLYILSDQQVADRFAAQRVRISGTLNRATGILTVQSIRATS